jgi:Na+/proline symporter
MVAGSALFSRNIYARYLHPEASDANLLAVGRWSGLIVVFAGLAFSFLVPSVVQALTVFWAVNTLTGVLVWFGVLWRRANTTGAWASFVAMLIPWLLFGMFGNALKPLLPGASWLGSLAEPKHLPWLAAAYMPAGLLAMIVGSLLGRGMDRERLDRFYLLLRTPVGREEELVKAGVDVVYAGSTTGHPWELKHPVAVNVGGFLVALAFSCAILAMVWGLARIGM